MADNKMPSGKDPIVKPQSMTDKLQGLSNNVNAVSIPKITSAYNVGKAKDFSAKQNNLAKFGTYGSEIYGKLGFDPNKNMNEVYDAETHWSVDIDRALSGMGKLAAIGVQDTFGLGAFASQGNYLDFEDTMNKYSSSRGGVAGFTANAMTSAGYTIGIIGGIALEELGLAGITALTGGAAAPGTIAAGGTLLAQGIGRIKSANNLLKSVNKLQDLQTATTWLGRRGQGIAKGTTGFAKALNPLENTLEFVKDIDKLKDFNGWKQAAIGAGAVVRDARKIAMSHSESKLEADLASKEFKQSMFDDFYLDPENIGKEIPQAKLDQIDQEAEKVHGRIYGSNFGLIYATNAITFDNMFKNMRSANKFFSTAEGGLYRTVKNAATKQVSVEAMAKTFGNAIRKKASQITLKSSLNSALSSSMEGVQELGQDVISESFKSYHARNVKGTQVRGGLLEFLHTDLSKAAGKQWGEEGAITFLSGALMGVFASPAGFATGQVNKFLTGGGIQKAQQRVFDNATWKAEKVSLQVKRKEKAKVLTEFFNNNKNFVDSFSNGVYTQNELQESILHAANNGDQKTLKDKQHESFTAGVQNLLESNLENEFADHLNYMADNFGPQELNEVFARTDITEENKGKHQQKLRDQAKGIKSLRQTYDAIQDTVVNPHSMQGVKVTDPEYLNKFIKYRSFENFKKELLFSHSKIADRANRIDIIQKELHQEHPLSSLEVDALLDTDSLTKQIELLELEVNANSEMKLTGAASVRAKLASTKLAAYTEYEKKLTAYKAEQKNTEGSVYESDAFADLFEAYNAVMATNDKDGADQTTKTERNKKTFDKIFDYINLNQENDIYKEFVDTLMNPSGASKFLAGQEEMLKRLDENKEEHISNALKAYEEKTTSDEMLNALYEAGLFFDLEELDDLIKNRMMPSEIFDIQNDNKEASPEQVKVAQDIINRFIKKLTGKSIVNDKTALNKQGRRLTSDKRTVSGIIRQYNLKLNKSIKLSSKEGQRLLEKMMASENKNLTKLDREILTKLGEQDATIRFITDGSLPVQITADGVIEMDLRFAGKDFKNSSMSFENLMVTGLTQQKITEKLKADDTLWLATRNAMEQAKVEFKKLYPTANAEDMNVFESPELFLTEAMNDLMFQKILSTINDTIQPASKSLWETLSNGIKEIVEEDFDKKLVTRVINIAAKALDSSIIENIAEESKPEVAQEQKEKSKEKFDELTTMAKELGNRWNVNVKVIASQEEAQKILDDIEDPFYQNEEDTTAGFYDEKTNTAYIVADAVKPNTAYHEIFLHPYLINLEKTNAPLYKALIDEAKLNKEAIDYVEKRYGPANEIGVRQYEHELIGRVYDMNVNNQLDKAKDAGLIKRLGQFIKKMFANIAEYLSIGKSDITRLNEKKATIADLAKYSVKGTSKTDLGKVIEADKTPISQPSPAQVKPTGTKKVTRERTITKLERVNKGGELLILDNASEQPGLFEEFLAPNIYFHDGNAIKKSTDEIVDIGEELDAKDIIENGTWEFGNLRAQVAGRLMIDVIATVPIFDSAKQSINQKYKTLQDKLIADKAKLLALKNQPAATGTKAVPEQRGKAINEKTKVSKVTMTMGTAEALKEVGNTNDIYFYVTEDIAKEAYEKYAIAEGKYVQSYSEVVRRGGFGINELDEYVPDWRTKLAIAKQNELGIPTTKQQTIDVHVAGIEKGYNESEESVGKSVGDIRGVVQATSGNTGQLITKGAINGPTQNDNFFVFWTKVDNQGKPLSEFTPDGTGGRDGYVSLSVKISDNPTQAEIDDVKKATIAKWNQVRAGITGGKFVLSKINATPGVTIDVETSTPVDNKAEITELEKTIKQDEDNLKSEPEYITTKTSRLEQVGTKKVRFLMYKSTGTGSTAQSLGEWTPLIHIGKRIDPNTREVHEWFVKALFAGGDPKLNKYGSDSFAALDKILKQQEDTLFDKPADWVEVPVEETITEEIEVPIDEADLETELEAEVPPEEIKTSAEIINKAEKIQSDIKSIEKQIESLNETLASTASFVQKRTARRKLTEASIELNDLYLQLNDIQPALDIIKNTNEAADLSLEYIPSYDYNNNEVITHLTPWMTIPEALRTQLSNLYGKSLNKLNQEDVAKIKSELKTNPNYISLVAGYTNARLKEQDLERSAQELSENKRKVDAAKAARQVQLDEETAASKLSKKAQRQAKQPPSNELILKNLLKDFDYSILTPAEIDSLIAKFKDKSGLLEFTVNDIIAFITNKKIKQEKEAQKKQLRIDIEESVEKVKLQKELDARIEGNYKMLSRGSIGFEDKLKNKIRKNVPKDMVKFIKTYHPKIFELPYAEFIQEVSDILAVRKNRLALLKNNPIEFKPKAIHLQLHSLVKSLENKKELFPETVYQINLALYKANSNLRVKIVRPGKNATVSSMYYIGQKSAGEKRSVVQTGKYAKVRDFVKNALLNKSVKQNAELAIVQYFMAGNKVRPTAVPSYSETERKGWSNIFSDNADKDTATFDGAGDYILEGAGLPVQFGELYAGIGANAFNSFISNYTDLNDAISKIGAQLIEDDQKEDADSLGYDGFTQEQLDEKQQLSNFKEQGLSEEEALLELNNLKFLLTPEGQVILDAESADLNKYYESLQSEINDGAFEGNVEDLSEEDQDLFTSAEEKGIYTEEGEPEVEVEEEELSVESLAPTEPAIEGQSLTESKIEKQVTALFNDVQANVPLSSQLEVIWNNVNNSNRGNITYAIAAYRYVVNSALPTSPPQKAAARIILNGQAGAGVFNNKIVNINNKAYRIADYENGKMKLQDLQNPSEFKLIPLVEFLNNVIDELEPGQEFSNMNIDAIVKVNEIDYIKEAYNEIFNNFTSFMGEANALTEEELMRDLKTETTKCK